MPIVAVEHFERRNIAKELQVDEPLMWDTDTLTGTCRGLVFEGLNNGRDPLDMEFINACDRIPRDFRVFSVQGLIVRIRLNFARLIKPPLMVPETITFFVTSRRLDNMLAFLMGTHPRLGAESEVRRLPSNYDANIMRLIDSYSRRSEYGNGIGWPSSPPPP